MSLRSVYCFNGALELFRDVTAHLSVMEELAGQLGEV